MRGKTCSARCFDLLHKSNSTVPLYADEFDLFVFGASLTSVFLSQQIAVYRGISYGIVGAAIGRPPTNCNAICWFSAAKQLFIALRRCDFVSQNHADEQCSPLQCLFELTDKWKFDSKAAVVNATAVSFWGEKPDYHILCHLYRKNTNS